MKYSSEGSGSSAVEPVLVAVKKLLAVIWAVVKGVISFFVVILSLGTAPGVIVCLDIKLSMHAN